MSSALVERVLRAPTFYAALESRAAQRFERLCRVSPPKKTCATGSKGAALRVVHPNPSACASALCRRVAAVCWGLIDCGSAIQNFLQDPFQTATACRQAPAVALGAWGGDDYCACARRHCFVLSCWRCRAERVFLFGESCASTHTQRGAAARMAAAAAAAACVALQVFGSSKSGGVGAHVRCCRHGALTAYRIARAPAHGRFCRCVVRATAGCIFWKGRGGGASADGVVAANSGGWLWTLDTRTSARALS